MLLKTTLFDIGSSNVKLLALDTATRQATVAVYNETKISAELDQEVTTHSEQLLTLIHQTLTAADLSVTDLDAIVCGRGPGSFTGLRIGLATAKGLCLAAQRPLICLSSLLPLAESVREALGTSYDGRLIAALIDARRNELFCGLYRGGSLIETEFLASPQALIENLQQREEDILFAGDGALCYRDFLLSGLSGRGILAPDKCHVIKSRYLVLAARTRCAVGDFDDLATTVPLYIRPSDARLPSSMAE